MTTTLHEALKSVSNHCDHARTWDHVGFSGRDAEFANSIAQKDRITAKMEWYIARFVRKYRRQVVENAERAGTQITQGLKGKAKVAAVDVFLASLTWEHQSAEEVAAASAPKLIISATVLRLQKYAAPGDAFRVIRAARTLRELDKVTQIAVVYGPEVSEGVRKLLREQCPEGTCFIEQETDFTVVLSMDRASLICLRMALVNRLNYIDAYEQSGAHPDPFLAAEKVRTNELLTRLPEPQAVLV
jgi:hypothetical protein